MKVREFYRILAPLGVTQQNWLFAHLMGKEYGELYLENPQVHENTLDEAKAIMKKVEAGEPLAYLLGESYFYGRVFHINPHVLIPRPETEGLVELALSLPWEKALDLCTGSGVIAISLALEGKKKGKQLHVDALDLSEEALAVAKANGERMEADVNFFLSDLFSEVEDSYDLLISNPPYVEREEVLTLPVGLYEPHLALDGGVDGLDVIEDLIRQAPNYLKEEGFLLLEIGENQGEEVLEMAKPYFYGTIKDDLANKVRYFVGKKRKIC